MEISTQTTDKMIITVMNTFIYILKTSRGVAASLQYHIMYLDDIKIFAKKTIRDLDGSNKKIDGKYIGMEFWIEQCAILINKNKHKSNSRRNRTVQIWKASERQERRKITSTLGILKADSIKQTEKEKNFKKSTRDDKKFPKIAFQKNFSANSGIYTNLRLNLSIYLSIIIHSPLTSHGEILGQTGLFNLGIAAWKRKTSWRRR